MSAAESNGHENPGSRSPHVLVGACGAVNVINLHCYLIALLEQSYDVRVILTRPAGRLVRAAALRAVVRSPVFTDRDAHGLPVPHADLADWADAVVVLPATANVLGKAAAGIADDLLTTVLLAAVPPVVFVPSMNRRMWAAPAVRRNVRTLEGDGHLVVRAAARHDVRELSSGDTAPAELMPGPAELAAVVRDFLTAGRRPARRWTVTSDRLPGESHADAPTARSSS